MDKRTSNGTFFGTGTITLDTFPGVISHAPFTAATDASAKVCDQIIWALVDADSAVSILDLGIVDIHVSVWIIDYRWRA
jgi:hypothetical protein